MGVGTPVYRLNLSGAFRLLAPDGTRIDISSKRGQALIAMLATAGGGERTRSWLQDRLWGSRAPEQASASLRRELSNLRKLVHTHDAWLHTDFQRAWVDLSLLKVDVRDVAARPDQPFLEGLDLAGEDGFEDWLRAERAALETRRQDHERDAAPAPVVMPTDAPLTIALAEFSGRPAIAVLPFTVTNAGEADGASAIVAQGLAEDLIDRLSALRWLPVIARSSAFALNTGSTAGAALNARYVVEGHVRGSGTARVLSATLTDAANGQLLWSQKMPLPKSESMSIGGGAVDEMLSSIAANLGLKVDQAEQARAAAMQGSTQFHDLIWRGRWHLNRLTKADAAAARACFDAALAMAPDAAEALIQSAWVRLWELWVTRGKQTDIREVRQMAQRAIIADYDDARGHMLAGIAEIWLLQPLRAESLLRRAIALNPSLVMAHAQLGTVLNLQGRHHDALENLFFANRLSPNDPELFFTLGEIAGAHVMMGQHDAALDYAERALARRPAYWLAHVIKINALVHLKQEQAAAAARAELVALKPDFTPAFVDWLPYIDPAKRDFLKAGLNRVPA